MAEVVGYPLDRQGIQGEVHRTVQLDARRSTGDVAYYVSRFD